MVDLTLLISGAQFPLRSHQRGTCSQHHLLRLQDTNPSGSTSRPGPCGVLHQGPTDGDSYAPAGLRPEVLVPAEAGSLLGPGIFVQDSGRRVQGGLNRKLQKQLSRTMQKFGREVG